MNKIEKAEIVTALSQCLQNPQVYRSVDELPSDLAKRIPAPWRDLLGATTQDAAHSALRQLWKPMATRMKRTIALLEEVVEGFAILHFGGAPLLLYLINAHGGLQPYAGGLPVEEAELPAKIQAVWSDLPTELRALYGVHNGWQHFCYSEGGFQAVGKLFFLSDLVSESDIADLLEETPIELDSTLIVTSDSGGRNLGFELPPEGGSPVPILFGKETLDDTIHFWFELEGWIAESMGH